VDVLQGRLEQLHAVTRAGRVAALAATMVARPVSAHPGVLDLPLGASGPVVLGMVADVDPLDPPPTVEAVVLDPRDCTPRAVLHLLDSGPMDARVTLHLVWDGRRWAFAEDWRVEGDRLLRPGHPPFPLTRDAPDGTGGTGGEGWAGATRVRWDERGAVIGVQDAGGARTLTRDDAGTLVSIHDGAARITLEDGPTGGRASGASGDEVRWTRAGERLARLVDRRGRVLADSARPWSLAVADGPSWTAPVRDGTTHLVHDRRTWACRVGPAGTTHATPGPGGGDTPRGGLAPLRDGEVMTDASGRVRRVARDALGRLAGWEDAGVGRTTLTRDPAGRITGVDSPSHGRWGFAWSDGGLVAVDTPGGERWTLTRAADGARVRWTDPAGRSWDAEADDAGRRLAWRAGGRRRRVERDGNGLVVALEEGLSGRVRLVRDAAGRVVRIDDPGAGAWQLPRDADGAIAALIEPGGARWAFERDPDGALRTLRAPDGRAVTNAPWAALRDAYARDAAPVPADPDAVVLRRDAAGRPLAGRLPRDGTEVAWDRDAEGRVTAVSIRPWSPGAEGASPSATPPPWVLGLARDAAGAIREARAGEGLRVRLTRDPAGAVVRADDGHAPVILDRDGTGRIIALREGDGTLEVPRDPRGAVTAIRWQSAADAEPRVWRFLRDGVGRILAIEAPEGVRLGVDRDAIGRPRLVRFPGGTVAWRTTTASQVRATLDSGVPGEAAWPVTPAPAASRGILPVPPAAWRARMDALGRPTALGGPDGRLTLTWDALGRLTHLGAARTLGWNAPLAVGNRPRAALPEVAVARPGGGLVLDSRGVPVLAAGHGVLARGAGGLPVDARLGDTGPAGRLLAWPGGPAVGGLGMQDTTTGLPVGGHAARAEAEDSPWPDPDAAASVPWDPARFGAADAGPWSDPLRTLIALGELPDGGPRFLRAPGVPWLPASLAPSVPPMLPDPEGSLVRDPDALVELLVRVVTGMSQEQTAPTTGGRRGGDGGPPGG
jgi:YD repeat-containing protein